MGSGQITTGSWPKVAEHFLKRDCVQQLFSGFSNLETPSEQIWLRSAAPSWLLRADWSDGLKNWGTDERRDSPVHLMQMTE